MKPPTIEDRLLEIRLRLGLLGVLAHVNNDEGGLEEFQSDAREAILDVIRGAYDELHSLMQLPGLIANIPVPDAASLAGDDDEARAAALDAVVRDYLSHHRMLVVQPEAIPARPKAKGGAR